MKIVNEVIGNVVLTVKALEPKKDSINLIGRPNGSVRTFKTTVENQKSTLKIIGLKPGVNIIKMNTLLSKDEEKEKMLRIKIAHKLQLMRIEIYKKEFKEVVTKAVVRVLEEEYV